MKILVADDSSMMRCLLVETLRKWHYEVVEARNPSKIAIILDHRVPAESATNARPTPSRCAKQLDPVHERPRVEGRYPEAESIGGFRIRREHDVQR